MAVSLKDAAKLAASFPGVTEGARWGNRTWMVGEGKKAKGFAWERPFSKADVKRFVDAGETPPAGDILAIAVADLLEKEAALDSNPKAFFDIAHFKGYPAFLVQLSKVSKRDLQQALETAYRTAAPAPAPAKAAAVVERVKLTASSRLTAVQKKQFAVAAKLYFGAKKGPSPTIGDDDGTDPMKSRRLLFTEIARIAVDGKVAYDAWLYMGDSGTIFEANMDQPVAEVVQASLNCPDEARASTLREALGAAKLIALPKAKRRRKP